MTHRSDGRASGCDEGVEDEQHVGGDLSGQPRVVLDGLKGDLLAEETDVVD